ncbi:DNA double-strand break repair nuclease NurA [Stetteria hydrogenophila]
MAFTEIASAALETVKSMMSLVNGSGWASPSILRLDELAGLRAPAEDLGIAEAYVYESSPRPLRAVNPLPLNGQADGLGSRPCFLGVDSSSRSVEAAVASVVVAAVSLSGCGAAELADWPPVYEYKAPIPRGPPFIRILPNRAEPLLPELPEGVTARNPAGIAYDRDYSIAQALDEARVELENWAISAAPSLAPGRQRRLVVFVDGPLFTVPGALADPGAPAGVREAWRELVARRVEAVRRVEEAGGVVIGVVKRLSRSRILSKALGRWGSCGAAEGESDEFYLHRVVASSRANWRPGQVYKSVKVAVRQPSLPGVPLKIAEYLAIPPGAWHGGPRGLLLVRLEYTEESLKRLRSWGLEPLHAYSLASIAVGSRLPTPLLASDKRAKSISKALKRLLAEEMTRLGIPLDYESLVEEAGAAWRRAAAY